MIVTCGEESNSKMTVTFQEQSTSRIMSRKWQLLTNNKVFRLHNPGTLVTWHTFISWTHCLTLSSILSLSGRTEPAISSRTNEPVNATLFSAFAGEDMIHGGFFDVELNLAKTGMHYTRVAKHIVRTFHIPD